MLDMLNLSGRRRLSVIRQNEAAECGLACLAMIAGYYGYQTDLSTLRYKFPVGIRGTTLRSLMDVATKLDFSLRPIKLQLPDVRHLHPPVLLHWGMNHFVVLKAVAKNKFTVVDPAIGECVYCETEFSENFTGVAIELRPTEQFKKREEKTTLKLSDMWGRMFGLKDSLVQMLVLSCILQVFVLVSPFYLQLAVDEVLTSFDTNFMLMLAIGFAGLTIFNVIAETLRGYVLLYFGSMLSFQMSGNLFQHLLRLELDFFEKRHIGDITSRFGSMEPIRKMLTEGLIAGVIDGIMAITTLILMFIYSPLLGFIALGAWASYFVIRLTTYRMLHQRQEGVIVAQAREQTAFMESVRGIVSVKLFGGEEKRRHFWQNRLANTINENAKFQKLTIWFASTNSAIFGMERIVLIFVAVGLVLGGTGFTVGMIFAFMAYKTQFTDKASALVERVIEFRMLGLHLERLADITQAEQETIDASAYNDPDFQFISGSITCENITYRYAPDLPDVLKDASLHVEAGTSVAIVGHSGCGKTTLLKILTGLIKEDNGRVLVDGKPIQDYGLLAFRQQIGVVMQEDSLFAGSLAENISFFDDNPDMKRIISAAQTACMHDEIMAMPMKYESLVGDMGSTLSGGQKQRVMLARALYCQPKVLFMDEGTSHLDVLTEQMVSRGIANLDITRVIIAHRPETINSTDRVMELCDGALRELDAKPSLNTEAEDSEVTTICH